MSAGDQHGQPHSFRIDHVINNNDRLFVRYSAAPVTSVRFQGFP